MGNDGEVHTNGVNNCSITSTIEPSQNVEDANGHGSDSGESCSSSIIGLGDSEPVKYDAATEKVEKLKLMKNYRKLIRETKENQEELVKVDDNELMSKLDKMDRLFQDVNETRTGVLDSKLLSMMVTIGTKRTSAFKTDLVAFDPDEFMLKVALFMGGTVSGPNEPPDIPDGGWEFLSRKVIKYFPGYAPAIHPLLGAFETTPHARKPKIISQAPQPQSQSENSNPTSLKTYENIGKEGTPQEIEKVFNIIKTYYADDPTPIDYFELVLNAQSYGLTIENIFHLAFLVKDGLVKIFLGENGLPVVEPLPPENLRSNGNSNSRPDKTTKSQTSQMMVSLSMPEWQELIDAYELKGQEPMIPVS